MNEHVLQAEDGTPARHTAFSLKIAIRLSMIVLRHPWYQHPSESVPIQTNRTKGQYHDMIFTIRSTEKHGSQSPDNNQMETSQSTEAPEEPVVTSQIQTRLVKTSTAETLMRVHYSNICCIM